MQNGTRPDEGKAPPASDAPLFSRTYVNPNGKHTFELRVESDGIAYGMSHGSEDEESALSLRKIFHEAKEHLGGPFPVFFDLSDLTNIDPLARKIWSDTALSKDSPFKRVAVLGGDFFIRSLMNFYARVANIPVRLFKSREEALAWVREGLS